MRTISKIFLVLYLLTGNKLFAQVDYQVFKYGTDIQPADSQKLS